MTPIKTVYDNRWERVRGREWEREREMHMGMFHIMNADKNTDY